MFIFALLIGIYSYILFVLGIIGLLYPWLITTTAIVFWGGISWWKKQNLLPTIRNSARLLKYFTIQPNSWIVLFVMCLFLQAIINLIGTLGPELAFDALWYHLTIPKLWLLQHSLTFIPGGLLYYSAMPKLGELLFLPGLVLGGAVGAKLIHFSFGILVCVVLYHLQRKFFSSLIALIGVVIFYSNLVVGWESITAYIDLIRTFFEVLALFSFVNWYEKKELKWILLSAVMIGFAIATKLLAIGSLLIFCCFLLYSSKFKQLALYISVALIIPLPWFIFSYLNTGNPIYPFFTNLYHVAPETFTPQGFISGIWNLLLYSSDPLSPLYLIFMPLIMLCFTRFSKSLKLISFYSLLSLIVWYLTPRTGGGRFILAYLPAFSILCAACIHYLFDKQNVYPLFRNFVFSMIIFLALSSIGYRLLANAKYLPVLLGQQSQQSFLTARLNFSFGDFYDTDNYLKEHIGGNDNVLLYGFHNLYYVDFPFVDSSWMKPSDKFTYIATQKTTLPEKYKSWKLVYENKKTMVKLYKRR